MPVNSVNALFEDNKNEVGGGPGLTAGHGKRIKGWSIYGQLVVLKTQTLMKRKGALYPHLINALSGVSSRVSMAKWHGRFTLRFSVLPQFLARIEPHWRTMDPCSSLGRSLLNNTPPHHHHRPSIPYTSISPYNSHDAFRNGQ